MIELKSEPYKDTDKLADDALEELNSLGLEYGAHTVIGMALGKLKAYEGTGLTPEQVTELQEDYAVKGTLLAEYQATGITPEQIKVQMENLKTAYSIIDDYEKKISYGMLLRLPCNVGDTVYVLAECEKIQPVLDGDYENATGYYCPYELNRKCPHDDDCKKVGAVTTVFEDTVRAVYVDESGIEIVTENCNVMGEIGKYIFLSREDAEKALAEMEEKINA